LSGVASCQSNDENVTHNKIRPKPDLANSSICSWWCDSYYASLVAIWETMFYRPTWRWFECHVRDLFETKIHKKRIKNNKYQHRFKIHPYC